MKQLHRLHLLMVLFSKKATEVILTTLPKQALFYI